MPGPIAGFWMAKVSATEECLVAVGLGRFASSIRWIEFSAGCELDARIAAENTL
jgi:hypothetical protein